MPKKVEVYGHSDDCIVVSGGGLDDEFSAYDVKKYLHFGDGTVIKCQYAPHGRLLYSWWILPERVGKGTKVTRVPGTYDGQRGCRCDKLIIEGDLKSVKCWSTADGPDSDDVEYFFDTLEWRDLTTDQAKRIMVIVEEDK